MEGSEDENYQPTRIEFKRKTKSASSTSFIQLGIATALGALTLGWLYLGNEIFYYVAWVAIPLYLFYRLKNFNKRR